MTTVREYDADDGRLVRVLSMGGRANFANRVACALRPTDVSTASPRTKLSPLVSRVARVWEWSYGYSD